jgi:hypothetical protein
MKAYRSSKRRETKGNAREVNENYNWHGRKL